VTDLLVIGGGLAGASLAVAMSREGADVILVERERSYRDRVRGEVIAAWGTVEARRLGLLATLLDGCATEVPTLSYYLDGEPAPPIDLRSAAPHFEPSVAFLHAEMQEALIREAEATGATVLRPAKLVSMTRGDPPTGEILVEGDTRIVQARLIVGCDGRDSQVCRMAGFERHRDPDELLSTGLLVQGDMATGGAIHYWFGPAIGHTSAVCEVAHGFYRVYVFHHTDAGLGRLSGSRAFDATLEILRGMGVPSEWLDGARLAGPLATFDGSHRWVKHPYQDGVVLIGDAAAASDPTWGSGLSRTLRDVRLLRDALVENVSWRRAADAYAEQHDDYWDRLHDVERLSAAALLSATPDAAARRARALEIIDSVPELEMWTYGPEASCDDTVREQLLAPVG
jgi:2-polyprenyl-6-methoxyphenol hydroxylase-like FAD-dependent oxidoreductase